MCQLSFTLYIAPNASPTKPHILSFSSTSVLLMWQPPPAENMNGRLRYYSVWYTEQETSLHSSVSTNSTSLELIDLHPYFTYTIKVRAETISPGPFSAEQSVQLEEDGMLVNYECKVVWYSLK